MTSLVVLSFVLLSPATAAAPARVAVMIDAPVSINALEAAVALPAAPGGIKSKNSAMSYWIEEPHYDAQAGSVSFAGVVPAGFSGHGELFEMTLPQGVDTLSITNAKAYLNGPDAREAPLSTQSLSLSPPLNTGGLFVYILGVALVFGLIWLVRHLRLRLS